MFKNQGLTGRTSAGVCYAKLFERSCTINQNRVIILLNYSPFAEGSLFLGERR
jgi:hypothetical protein